MKRTFAIGDIHGGLKALVQLIEKIQVTKDDTLIFLGDYVDGWSESAQVIQYLIEFAKEYNCIFIKGNHDTWLERWLNSSKVTFDKGEEQTWLFNGGKSTVASYSTFSKEEKKVHLNFLEAMPFYHIDENNRLFVHAGFTSKKGPEEEIPVSNCCWDRTLWQLALTTNKHPENDRTTYPKQLLLFYETYIGHTPTSLYGKTIPMQSCNVFNIDTGAAFLGKLSAVDIDTKKIYQSDIVQTLYENEKGRNTNPYRIIKKKI